MSERPSSLLPETFSRRQQAIVEACLSEFNEEGCFATSIEGIAERAGVATGTVYRHYKSKMELLGSALEQACQMAPTLEEQGIRHLLQYVAESFFTALKERTNLALLIEGRLECSLKWLGGDFSPAVRFEDNLTEALAKAMAAGEIRPDADARLLAQSFLYQFRIPRFRDLAMTAEGATLADQVVECFLRCYGA